MIYNASTLKKKKKVQCAVRWYMDWLEGRVQFASETKRNQVLRCLLEPRGELLDLAKELGLYLIKRMSPGSF